MIMYPGKIFEKFIPFEIPANEKFVIIIVEIGLLDYLEWIVFYTFQLFGGHSLVSWFFCWWFSEFDKDGFLGRFLFSPWTSEDLLMRDTHTHSNNKKEN